MINLLSTLALTFLLVGFARAEISPLFAPIVIESDNARAYVVPPLSRFSHCARCADSFNREFERGRVALGGFSHALEVDGRAGLLNVSRSTPGAVVEGFVAGAKELGFETSARGHNRLYVEMPVKMSVDAYMNLKTIQDRLYRGAASAYNPESGKPFTMGESLLFGGLFAASVGLTYITGGVNFDGLFAGMASGIARRATFEVRVNEEIPFMPARYKLGPVPAYAVDFSGFDEVHYRSVATDPNQGFNRMNGEVVIGVKQGITHEELDAILARSLVAAASLNYSVEQLAAFRAQELEFRKRIRSECLAAGLCE